MTTTTQTRAHSGHSHGHHHHDNTYLTSSNKNDAGVRITRIGLFVNLGMAIGKTIGGYYFNSQALVADGFHSLTDLVSDFMTLATISWSLKPPTTRFPGGYGKIESLGSLGVSGLLLAGGVIMGMNACEVLYSQYFLDVAAHHEHAGLFGGLFGHSHSHSHGDMGPNVNAAWIAAGSILVKEYLYQATMKIAKDRKSSILASNAVHHRIDSLTSFVALVTIGGSHFFHDAAWLDPVGGLLISIMVIRAGWNNTGSALLELADVGVDEEMKSNVRRAATKALETGLESDPQLDDLLKAGKVEVREIQGVKSGQNYLMEIGLGVPNSWNVVQCQEVEKVVREKVGRKVRGVRRVKIRFVPKADTDLSFSNEFIGADVSPRSSPEPEDHGDHHHHENGNTKKRT
ncbi:MAG: hypothetical protein M1827_000953 [Pycnora praestabilis]|nr:MAG: hypothetical protein M1827_000953 [Pycnora praestabilis]